MNNKEYLSRLFARYNTSGRGAVTEIELLEMVLSFTMKHKAALCVTRVLLQQFGSLRGVLQQTPQVLETYVEDSKTVTLLKLFKDVLITYFEPQPAELISLSNPELVAKYLRAELGSLEREHFMVLYLDTKMRLLKKEVLFYGTLDQAQVYPREILKLALLYNASSVILCHNHPSGISLPSDDDNHITQKLTSLAREVNLRVCDHFIVTPAEVYSIKTNTVIK